MTRIDRENREKIRAFAQKMHDEGAAGFASGLAPWEAWNDFDGKAGSRIWRGTSERVPERDPSLRSFGDRVLTAMTALSVAALAIGVVGVYFSEEPALQVANNREHLPVTTPILTPEIPLDRRGTAVVSRETYAQVYTDWIPAIDAPQTPTAGAIIANNQAAETTGMQAVITDSNTPLTVMPDDDSRRLAALEQQPALPDIPVAPVPGETRSMNDNTATAGPDADSETVLAVLHDLPAPAAGIPVITMVDPEGEMPVTDAWPEQQPEADGDIQSEITPTVADEPDISAPSGPVPDWEAKTQTVLTAATGPDFSTMSGPVSSLEAQAEITPTEVTGPDAPAPAEPVQLARLSVPDVPADPVQAPSRKPAREPAPGEQTAAGDGWSINIASYTREATAEKMRSRFLDKGVETNIATALVNGKTYYRLRVSGLANRAEATVKSTEIKEKLGLKETWITRQ